LIEGRVWRTAACSEVGCCVVWLSNKPGKTLRCATDKKAPKTLLQSSSNLEQWHREEHERTMKAKKKH
jgi:hypothetical protein